MSESRIVTATEWVLSRVKRRRYISREKQRRRGPILDWLDALLWMVLVVFILNQYLFQAYEIPSPSMEDTLLVGDRVFVNKLVYGPQLLPGIGKLPGLEVPARGDIIVFENPDYESRGVIFDTLQRIIFLITFSFVNIDRDEAGEDRPQLLVKRVVAEPGDRIQDRRDGVLIQPAGTAGFGQDPTASAKYVLEGENYWAIVDRQARSGYSQEPHNKVVRSYIYKRRLGWYVPPGHFFPLGDNRDKSGDARAFGPVPFTRSIGRPFVRFWPPHRWGNPDAEVSP